MNPCFKSVVLLCLFLTAAGIWCTLLFRFPPPESSDAQESAGRSLRRSILPPCPIHYWTGFYCPGCGSTRSCQFLLRGEFRKSLRYHPLILPLLPFLLFLLFRFFYEGICGRPIPLPHGTSVGLAFLILFVLFTAARNLPFTCFDLLRPPSAPTDVELRSELNAVSFFR